MEERSELMTHKFYVNDFIMGTHRLPKIDLDIDFSVRFIREATIR